MRRKRRRPHKQRGIGMPVLCCLLCAAALIGYARGGGEETVLNALARLADNQQFALSALALEMGVFPDSASTVYHPYTMESGQEAAYWSEHEDDEFTESGESGYMPFRLNGQEAEEITLGTGSGKVTINNQTNLSVNLDSLLANPVRIRANTDGPQVLIVHTHSSEAYTPDEQNNYIPSENDRTLDARYNVIRVGAELADTLESRGVGVVHCQEVFDYPAYNGSYDRSLAAIEKTLAQYPSIQIVIDVHRDSMITAEGVKYKTSAEIDGKKMAQLMLVVGTNGGGLTHDNWQSNLNYAANLQKRIAAEYPSLMRPLNLRNQRFNQHARVGSMLIEVGSSGNTLTEAIDAAILFGELLADDLLSA